MPLNKDTKSNQNKPKLEHSYNNQQIYLIRAYTSVFFRNMSRTITAADSENVGISKHIFNQETNKKKKLQTKTHQ